MQPSHDVLTSLGWGEDYRSHLDALEGELEPGRVAIEHRGSYSVITRTGEVDAQVSGRVSFNATERSDLPAVGDWVALVRAGDTALIQAVLPRRTAFSRKVAGRVTEEQVVAANVDHVFVCAALDAPPHLRRIERYLTLAWQSGAIPVVLLTKSDLGSSVPDSVSAVARIAPGVTVVPVSALDPRGHDALAPFLGDGRTVALLGPSGVGKSTLVNRILGREEMSTHTVRSDGKGRHTTTHRQLIPLPQGGALIDTPGMRELQLWDADEGLDSTFPDIANLAAECRFRDCGHETEPGCAVRAALDGGDLDPGRFDSYRKQQRELAALMRRQDRRLAKEATRRWTLEYKEARSRSRHR